MGCDASTPFSSSHQKLAEWTLTKAIAVCRDHADSEPSFTLDYGSIMELTGLDNVDSQSLVTGLSTSKSKSGSVDCVSFCAVLLLVAEPSELHSITRLDALFSLIDYSRSGIITPDEAVILLLAIDKAIASIVCPKEDISDKEKELRSVSMYELGNEINKAKCRCSDSLITRQEFIHFCTDFLNMNLGSVYTLTSVLTALNARILTETQ